jgi:hypothetical protein
LLLSLRGVFGLFVVNLFWWVACDVGRGVMYISEIFFRVWAEYTNKRGYKRRYSRDFDTLQEGEKGYKEQINKGRFAALYRYTRTTSGASCANRLLCNW